MGKLENVWKETNVKNFWTWKSFNVLLCSERNKHWESIYNGTQGSIDLFRLYICCRSCDYTGKNCVFQNSSHSRAHVHIIHKKIKGKILLTPSFWLGKQNKQAKEVCFYGTFSLLFPAFMQRCWNKRKGLHTKRVQLPGQAISEFPPSLCFKARLSATPLRWKWFFIIVQINFIFTSDNKVSALSFMAYLSGKPTWPTYHCFGTPIWPLWLHVKRLYRNGDVSLGEWLPRSDFL